MNVSDILQRFKSALLSIAVEGPPHYDCGRVIVRGDPNGFRFLASLLQEMADTVSSSNQPASRSGWHLGLKPEDVPQLRMNNAILVLDCDPSMAPQ